MARKKSITKRRKALFLEKLRGTGSVTKAAIAGEIGRSSWYDKRDTDAEFAQAWDDEELGFLDDCESESIRRAIVGVNEHKPYTRLHKNGDKTTEMRTVNTKSDRLLELTLKSRHPNYKPVKAVEVTSPDGSMTPSRTPAPDFSALSDDELVTYTELLRKAHAATATA